MKRRKLMKKGLAMLLAVTMMTGMVPNLGNPLVYAAEPEIVEAEATEEQLKTTWEAPTGKELQTTEVATTVMATAATKTTDKYDLDGDGVKDIVYEISSMDHLTWFRDQVNAGNTGMNAVLTNNISVTGGWDNSIGMIAGEVIGEETLTTDREYQGIFDGQGYTIKNHYIAALTSNRGLFGHVNGGEIRNLELDSTIAMYTKSASGFGSLAASIKGNTKISNVTVSTYIYDYESLTGLTQIGGIVGKMYNSTIENCSVSGSILIGGSTNSIRNVGGIAGYAYGSSVICGCTSRVQLGNNSDESYRNAGGIAGYASDNTTIEKCLNYGSFNAGKVEYGGGIVGYATGSVSVLNCGNAGAIQASSNLSNAGGLIGYVNIGSFKGMTNCYNAGSVSLSGTGSASGIGGIVGKISADSADSTIKDNYYKEGINAYGSSSGGTAISVTADQIQSGDLTWKLNGNCADGIWKQTLGSDNVPNFSGGIVYYFQNCTGWVYSNTSEESRSDHIYANGICSVCDGYEPCAGSGTGEDPYLIDNAGKLFAFAQKVNSAYAKNYGKLTSDIDLEGREFAPIGISGSDFTGVFDGQDHTISNLKINTAQNGLDDKTYNYQGMFGVIRDGAEIKNLIVKGEIVCKTGSMQNIGGVVGLAYEGSKISNVTSYVNINDGSSSYQGIECVGGVVGRIGDTYQEDTSASVENCCYRGTIDLDQAQFVGGIVGKSIKDSNVSNCENHGTIGSNNVSHIAGIVGSAQTGTVVEQCINHGNITSYTHDCIGGVAGYANEEVLIQNCGNMGTVTGYPAKESTDDQNSYVGGILGYVNNAAFAGVQNCFNYGTVTAPNGDTYCGAIVGWLRNAQGSEITNNFYEEGTENYGTINETNVTDIGTSFTVTDAQMKSGEITWKLNGSSAEGVWKQTIGTDEYPNFSGETVYAYQNCTQEAYSNSLDNVESAHVYENGICKVCDGYEPCVGNGTEEAPYLLKNAGNLYWFAEQVNAGNTTICGKVENKITVNEDINDSTNRRKWTPISRTDTQPYNGKFDGGNNTICGLYYEEWDDNVGLFGVAGADAIIQNVCVENTYFKSAGEVGGIVGYNIGGTIINCGFEGTIYAGLRAGGIVGYNRFGGSIRKCYNTGSVKVSDFGAGGIIGTNQGTEVLSLCYNTGTITGERLTGGIVGNNEGSITKCFNTGGVSADSSVGFITGDADVSKVTDCYYLSGLSDTIYGIGDTTEDVEGSVEGKSAAQFASGEIAWAMNGKVDDGIWKQTLGTDALPNFSGASIYREHTEMETLTFTNTPSVHMFENGCCKICGQYAAAEGDGTKDSPYQIKTVTDLYWFAQQVNKGNTNIHGKLMNAISVNENVLAENWNLSGEGSSFREWMPIGSEDSPFEGTFNGNGYVISGLYYNDTSAMHVGIFGNVGKTGIVQDLKLTDSYLQGNARVGGIVGCNNGTIRNCFNSAYVCAIGNSAGGVTGRNNGSILVCGQNGLINGKRYIGGIAGHNAESANITNCYNTGNVKGTLGTKDYVGGVVGYNYGFITSSYSLSEVTGSSSVGDITGYNNSTKNVQNCYGTKNVNSEEEKQKFASGEITWKLNGESTEGVWKQTIGVDLLPQFTGETVYFSKNCANVGKYSNVPMEDVGHVFDEDDICTVCGSSVPCEGEGTENSPYLIKTISNLYWFAAQVNSGENEIYGKLQNDIIVNSNVLQNDGTLNGSGSDFRVWTPIGTEKTPYIGSFDGDGHIVKGLFYDNSATSYIGLFGYIGKSGNVQKVIVTDSYMRGNSYVGGIAGYNKGRILNCGNMASLESYNSLGGISGYNSGTVQNCYNTGKISNGRTYLGSVVGQNASGTVTNCFYLFRSAVNYYNYVQNGLGAVSSSDVTADSAGNTTAKSKVQFASGEVAYLLNEEKSDGVWKQDIGTDTQPVLMGKEVFSIVIDGVLHYGNDVGEAESHTYEDGYCTVCGVYEQCVGAGTQESPYLIENIGELYWFAEQVNAGNTAIHGKLKNNIISNENVLISDGLLNGSGSDFRTWTPIGTESNIFVGSFDGNGYAVKGLYFNDGEAKYVGLFGYVGEGGNVQNLQIEDSYMCAYQYVGGVAGYNKGTIQNCGSSSHIIGDWKQAGGIAGYNSGTIENCYSNSKKIRGARFYIGAIVGQNDSGTVTNCFYLFRSAADSYGNVQNGLGSDSLYDVTADSAGSTTAKSKVQFASGEVAYLLNEEKFDGVWKQDIGIDTEPKLTGGEVYRYQNSAGTSHYGNEPSGDVDAHTYENGYCKICGIYEPCVGEGNEESPYQIKSINDLYWFAEKVNTGETAICGKLMNDITINQNVLTKTGALNGDGSNFKVWIPIGSSETNMFTGVFDGNNHTIRGLYHNESLSSVGLIGQLGENGIVRDLRIEDSFLCGYQMCGAIAGRSYTGTINNCSNSGTLKGNSTVGGIVGANVISAVLTNCYNEGMIEADGNNGSSGGIAGGNTVSCIIQNCYNFGDVKGNGQAGGIAGNSNKGFIKYCYNVGKVRGTTNVGAILGRNYNNTSTITNCFYLEGCAAINGGAVQNGIGNTADTEGSTAKMTADQFASGEVAYKLQESQETQIWGQEIGKEDTPVLNGKKVYYALLICDTSNQIYAYANTETPLHADADRDGKCDGCGTLLDDMGAKLFGYTLSLNGNIGVNFYMELSDTMINDQDAYMQFNLPNGQAAKVYVKQRDGEKAAYTKMIDGATYYVFSCEVASGEMTQAIKAQMVAGDDTKGKKYSYTVRDYAKYIIDHPDVYANSDVEFAKALLNYGAYAQIHFDEVTDDLANKSLTAEEKKVDSITCETVQDHEAYQVKTAFGTFTGYSLVLKSETTLKVFFTPEEGVNVNELTFTAGGKVVQPVWSAKNGTYSLSVENVKAWDLDTKFNFTVSDGSKTGTFSCSALSYVYSVLKHEDLYAETGLPELVRALCIYQQKSEVYVTRQN